MTQSNNDNKLKDPSVRRLFEGKNFVFVSTLMKDGTPHLSNLGRPGGTEWWAYTCKYCNR
jgi:hypothetical protein